jgi:hypothetical protein
MNMKHVKFMYFRDCNRRPIGCVAIEVLNGTALKYAVSALHPYDIFNREVARNLALGRLVSHPVYISCSSRANLHTILTTVMRDVATTRLAPTNIIKSAKRWLTQQTTTHSTDDVLKILEDYLFKADTKTYIDFLKKFDRDIERFNMLSENGCSKYPRFARVRESFSNNEPKEIRISVNVPSSGDGGIAGQKAPESSHPHTFTINVPISPMTGAPATKSSHVG